MKRQELDLTLEKMSEIGRLSMQGKICLFALMGKELIVKYLTGLSMISGPFIRGSQKDFIAIQEMK